MSTTSSTVLLVEDEEAFIDALTVGLRREGFVVETARDGAYLPVVAAERRRGHRPRVGRHALPALGGLGEPA